MAKRPDAPARRKRRVIRLALLLPILLAALALALDFPMLTARQALRATQARYFFGPGEVITHIDFPRPPNTSRSTPYDRYYILRWGDWYAWCGVNHYGLFWQSGALDAVESDPALPLVPLVICRRDEGAILVVSNDPDIAVVEVQFPVMQETTTRWELFSVWSGPAVENCFVVSLDGTRYVGSVLYNEEAIRLRGFDAAGRLVYESPVPAVWDYGYGLSDPEEVS